MSTDEISLHGRPFSYGLVKLCGCARPNLLAKAQREDTPVQAYVQAKEAPLATRLARVLQRWARRAAKRLAARYKPKRVDKLAKDAPRRRTKAEEKLIEQLVEALNYEDLGRELNGELTNAMTAAFRRAASVGMQQVGFTADPSIVEQVDELAIAYAERRGAYLVTELADTTREDMRRLVTRAVEEGQAVEDLAAAILDMGGFSESRADMIARTELAFAHVEGNVEGWRETGLVVGKRSILADTHPYEDICDEAADAGIVGLDDEFVPGAKFPPYHPNCLCDVLPVLRGEDGT